MDNLNLNPIQDHTAQNTGAPAPTFPSFEDIEKKVHKPKHFITAIVILVAVGAGLIWYLAKDDFNFIPAQVKRSTVSQDGSSENEVSAIEVGNIDTQFQSVDQDLNSL